MTSRDNALWQQCWRDRQTDFHQTEVSPLLARFWRGLDLAPGSRVFVPLCGKSLDMIWLAQQGHEVIGLELSPVAVRAFFRENHMQPTRRAVGRFTLWQSGKIAILCGDYFTASRAELGSIDVVYDRAALTALPEDLRRRYVAHLKKILPPACKVFLLTVEDAEAGEMLEVRMGISVEIAALYGKDFQIELAHVESVTEAGRDKAGAASCAEHKVYRLVPG
ncbi:MAG: thiopurine S-methyltransferase [Gammaproteobacteria bacterium]|nr:thiopurine S-methyltransferase [Gammaproteobacteria bacterium]MBU1776443.1 thiopurine S-methyltransferase [Gammaproteobacteria bacterium]